MALNFLDPQYKQTSISRIFGICDDQNKTPAYIDESDPSTWAAEVVNEDLKLVSFYPIDYCVDTLREDGKMDNRCDGLLTYEDIFIFVELKDRSKHKWVQEGLMQLEASIKHFRSAHKELSAQSVIRAQLCNKQRPRAVVSCNVERDKFKEKVGCIVNVNKRITIK